MPEFLKAWGTLIIAFLALVQPRAAAAWRRYVRPGTAEIYQTGTIEIGYSGFGATIGLHGTFRARYRDCFIRSVRLDLVKERDRSQHRFEWALFRSYRFVSGRQQEVAFELPAGFMLLTSQPYRYNILFTDTLLQNDIRSTLDPFREAWNQFTLDSLPPGLRQPQTDPASIQQAVGEVQRRVYPQFAQDPRHVDAFTRIDRHLYWEAGRYRLTMHVETAHPDRRFTQSWSFELTDQHVRTLRFNSIKIIQEACGQFIGQYNFIYPPYQP
jgi:hypothetical protein